MANRWETMETATDFIFLQVVDQTIKNSNIWRLNNTLLNNQQITEEIKKEIKTGIETMKMKTQQPKTCGTL